MQKTYSDTQEIYVDEFGDPGNHPKIGESGKYEPSRIFGYALSIKGSKGDFTTILVHLLNTDDPECSSRRKHETKARRLPDSIKEMAATRIRDTDTVCLAYYIDKLGDLPKGWMGQSGSERMVGLLLYSVVNTLGKVDSKNVLFIIDEHDAYRVKNLYELMESEFDRFSQETGKNIGFCIASSSRGAYCMGLQTHDIIANISLEKTERGNAGFAELAEIDIHCLDSTESILLNKS